MKIAIIGAGAMGSMFGAKLNRSGNEVCLVDVWREHVDAINRDGVLLATKGDGGEYIKVRAVSSAQEVGGVCDLVLIFVKGVYTEDAVRGAQCLIGEDTYVLTLQNGVGNADVIAQHVDPARVVLGTTTASATMLKPGQVNDTTEVVEGQFTAHITAMNRENGPRVQEIADTLTAAGIRTEVSENAEVAIWQKLAVNCCVNAPCMLTRTDCGVVTRDPNGEALQTSLISELCAVAEKKGIPISREETHQQIKEVFKHSTHHPSMSQDAYKRARTEIETITGAVVREGKKHRVSTPVNETLYNLVKIVEGNYDKLWY